MYNIKKYKFYLLFPLILTVLNFLVFYLPLCIYLSLSIYYKYIHMCV